VIKEAWGVSSSLKEKKENLFYNFALTSHNLVNAELNYG